MSDEEFRHADLRDCDLEGADFTGTDLREADLCGASLIAASFAHLQCSTRIVGAASGGQTSKVTASTSQIARSCSTRRTERSIE